MRCDEFEMVLKELIETKAPIPAEVREHGTCCDSTNCRTAWQDHLLLESLLPYWKELSLPVGFTDRVMQAVGSDKRSAGTEPVARGGVATADSVASARFSNWLSTATAALAVASLMAVIWVPSAEKGGSDSHLRNRLWSSTEPESLRHGLPTGIPLDEVHEVYAGWMEGASNRLRQTATLVLLEDAEVSDPTSKSSAGWLGTWSKRIEEYETEIGETFLKFVESTKMDQT